MWKITVSKNTNQPDLKIRRKTFTGFLDRVLLEKGRELIKTQQSTGNYQYNSITDLICVSLILFQKQELVLSEERNLNNPRLNTSFTLPIDLTQFYLSLPKGQRIGILERCLASFLKKWSSAK